MTLAIISLVLSALALLGVLILGLVMLGVVASAGGPSGPMDGPGTHGTLTGQATIAPSGGPLSGADLTSTVSKVVTNDGGDVADMHCPTTPKVDQSVVTVCHGTISGEAWAVVVFFEDTTGRFTLSPL